MFRDKLKTLRREKDLSQAALAEMCGVTQGSVSHWEKGRAYPEMSVAHKLCAIFNVSLSDLLDGEDTQPTAQEKATIEVVRFDGTKKDGKSNMLAAIFAELETMSEEDLKVALQHARFLKSQK